MKRVILFFCGLLLSATAFASNNYDGEIITYTHDGGDYEVSKEVYDFYYLNSELVMDFSVNFDHYYCEGFTDQEIADSFILQVKALTHDFILERQKYLTDLTRVQEIDMQALKHGDRYNISCIPWDGSVEHRKNIVKYAVFFANELLRTS